MCEVLSHFVRRHFTDGFDRISIGFDDRIPYVATRLRGTEMEVRSPFREGVDVLGGGNSIVFGIFTPIPGEMIQIDEHIFQMG